MKSFGITWNKLFAPFCFIFNLTITYCNSIFPWRESFRCPTRFYHEHAGNIYVWRNIYMCAGNYTVRVIFRTPDNCNLTVQENWSLLNSHLCQFDCTYHCWSRDWRKQVLINNNPNQTSNKQYAIQLYSSVRVYCYYYAYYYCSLIKQNYNNTNTEYGDRKYGI